MARKSAAKRSDARQHEVRFINPAQAGGIETSVLDDGPGRGVRVAWVNTGTPLQYRVVIDRGLDIADCLYGGQSLCFLGYPGITAPTPARDQGMEWLKGFFAGMLTSCGPQHAGAPAMIDGVQYSLHGTHSNTPASVEVICQPDPAIGCNTMSITGVIRTARMFGPNVELQRTIRSVLGEPAIHVHDSFTNRGNAPMRHCWLMHVNFGWPLLDEGARLVFKGTLAPNPGAEAWFADPRKYKRVPAATKRHIGAGEDVAFIDAAADRQGQCHVGIVNEKIKLGVELTFAKEHFPLVVNWQHFGPAGEYVCALEPLAGDMAGHGRPRTLQPGESRDYDLTLNVLTEAKQRREFLILWG